MAAGQAAGRGGLALALLIVVRELSLEDFGNLAFGLALVQVLTVVSDAGFSRLLLRDAARSGAAVGPVVRELLVARLLPILLVVVLAVLLSGLLPSAIGGATAALLIAYMATESLAYGFENAAAGAERPWRFAAAQSIAAIVLLGGVATLAISGNLTLRTTAAALACSSAIKVGGHLVAWRAVFSSPAATFAPPRSRAALLLEALPFLGLTLLGAIYYRVGVIALHAVSGAEETASYGAALRVLDAVAITAVVLFAAISPGLSRAHRDHPERILELWRGLTTRCAWLIVPPTVAVVVMAPTIAGLLFGPQYEHSAGADLRILAPGAAFLVLQSINAAVVFMADDKRGVTRLTAINVTACTAASLVLSAFFGSAGAALALTLAEVLSFISFAMLIHARHRAISRCDQPPSEPAASATSS